MKLQNKYIPASWMIQQHRLLKQKSTLDNHYWFNVMSIVIIIIFLVFLVIKFFDKKVKNEINHTQN
jgi:uncharacterized membrane protein YhdT